MIFEKNTDKFDEIWCFLNQKTKASFLLIKNKLIQLDMIH